MLQISENAAKLIRKMTARNGLPKVAFALGSRPAGVPG